MSEHSLINALSDIADDKITDALGVYERKRHQRSIFFRIAAVAATIAILLTVSLWPQKAEDDRTITSPGFLKVYAYDLSNGTPLELQEGVDLTGAMVETPSGWFENMNLFYGLPIKISVAEEVYGNSSITLDVTVDHGIFYLDRKNSKYAERLKDGITWESLALGNTFTVDNGEFIFWSNTTIYDEANAAGMDLEAYMDSLGNLFFADVIVRKDGAIVGYAIIEIRNHDGLYTAFVRDVVSYFDEEGKLVEVSESYVRQEIANCKAVQ